MHTGPGLHIIRCNSCTGITLPSGQTDTGTRQLFTGNIYIYSVQGREVIEQNY